jgi:hypothetical protein
VTGAHSTQPGAGGGCCPWCCPSTGQRPLQNLHTACKGTSAAGRTEVTAVRGVVLHGVYTCRQLLPASSRQQQLCPAQTTRCCALHAHEQCMW